MDNDKIRKYCSTARNEKTMKYTNTSKPRFISRRESRQIVRNVLNRKTIRGDYANPNQSIFGKKVKKDFKQKY